MKVIYVLLYLLSLIFGAFLYGGMGDPINTGSRYVRNYSRVEYDEQPQNWCLLQDKRGFIYAANQGGVLEYDGVSWRSIVIPNLTARSLAAGEDGIIYVGGVDEIGFLKPGINGSLIYESLLDKLDKNQRNFSIVWRCHSTREGIYFRTEKFLFRWNPAVREMKTWQPLAKDSLFLGSFVCGDRFFIRHKDIGLMQMKDDSLQPVPGGELFAQIGIFSMFPYDDRRLIIGTRSDGLFLYDGKRIVPFPTEVDDYLKEQKLSHGIRLGLSPGDFALATLRGGLVIMDEQGRVKELFTKASGLQDDNVKYLLEDSSGNLWLALDNGITKIEYASPISFYGEESNLPGIVLTVTRHGPRDHLYAGTSNGLYYLSSSANPANVRGFQPVPGISGKCNFLLSSGDSLLTATEEGIFLVDTGNNEPNHRKLLDGRSNFLLPSKHEPNRIWVGTAHGLASLYKYKTNNDWTSEKEFDNISEEITTIVEDEKGNLWLSTLAKGVLKIDFPVGGAAEVLATPVVTRYYTSHGLPPEAVYLSMAAGHMIVSTQKGIFRFDKKNNKFIPDDTLGKEFADGSRNVYRLSEDRAKNIWFQSLFRTYQAIPRPDGTYHIDEKPFLRIPKSTMEITYLDPDGVIVWLATHEGLIRYDTTVKKNYRRDFRVLVRRVLNINSKSVIFDGTGTPMPVFDYKDRNIRFEYAAPFFEDETRNEYGYLLEGYDKDWSGWTRETRKDYTNLDAGTYTFRIRAKNVYEHLSKEDVFRFKVLPPWYLTWWAYTLYAICSVLLFYLGVKWRHIQLVNEKRKLEQTVKDRTQEIEEKNRQLERQSEQLKELDEAKSRFFANISHEFRTPLTLIMGPLEKRLSLCRDKQDIQEMKMMLRNSWRLLNLINQLLELARLDSGKMKLQAAEQNIVPFLKNIVMCFESLAAQNKVGLVFHKEKDDITLYFDPEKLEKIITNLLSNAFNYTPEGGRITVLVRRPAETGSFPSGCVEISVRDTGSGIPANHLPHIFDRFYRVEGTHEYKRKGSGIGLALTKELVELHHGEIEVQSSCRDDHSRGTEFSLRLPLGKEHLQPEEIMEVVALEEQLPVSKEPSPAYAYTVTAEEEMEIEEEPGIPAETAADQPQAPKEQEEKPLILVVDDNADVRTYIRGSLEPYFKVVEAVDGKEGILRAKEIIPDLIVSDVMMPGTDGYELCRTLKNDVLTSHVPIILLTAKVSEESELQGLETGADDYITKPFSTTVLAVRVRNLIDLRRQLQLEQKNRMTLQPEELPVSPLDDEFYKKLLDTIEAHLSDPDFNVEALSQVLEMSQATLYRKIHALTGKSPTLFLRSFRIKRAALLLAANAGSVADVADRVGFPDKSYFAKCFKEQFNRLPSEIQAAGVSEPVEENEVNEKLLEEGGKREAGKLGQEIILVVEDSEDSRGYIRGSLEPGYHVVEAVDGSEGIARAMEVIPDLIVSDIMMPGTDGYELCRVLKKDVRTCHIPIVLLTAKTAEESIIRGMETGADDYITKPFNTNILLARIKNLIRLRSHLQNKRNREMTLLPAKVSESEIDREFLKELNAVIEKNLEDPGFNVEQLAKKLYMSSATLYRKIQALSGEIPSEYIRSYRLHKAAQLFKDNFGSVTEVAFEVGFTSRTYFTKCFKEKFHQLPSVYMSAKSL
jgi:DNA-binding response OmpR family regulator/signal transduction histidine kinase